MGVLQAAPPIQVAKATRLPPCDVRRVRCAAEPVDASTVPRLSSAAPSLGHVMLPGFPVMVRGNRQSHSRDLSPFGHRSSPEAPSLHRHYPASSVIRASPPPCRPNLSLAGCRLARATPPDRVSRVASIPLFHACCRQYPGGTCRCMRRSLPNRCQPSPLSGRVGFRIMPFEACSAIHFALRPAWLLSRPWRPVTSECFRRCRYLHHPLRLLPAGTTVAGRDSHPLKNGAFHGAPDKAHYVAFGHEKAPPGHSPEGQLSGSDNPALCCLWQASACQTLAVSLPIGSVQVNPIAHMQTAAICEVHRPTTGS